MPHTKKKDSLLNSDREKYSLGGQAAKAIMKRINKLLKKHKGDDAVKSDVYYIKEKLSDIDNELGGIGSENVELEAKLINELDTERAEFVAALKQIEEEGIPIEWSEEGFPTSERVVGETEEIPALLSYSRKEEARKLTEAEKNILREELPKNYPAIYTDQQAKTRISATTADDIIQEYEAGEDIIIYFGDPPDTPPDLGMNASEIDEILGKGRTKKQEGGEQETHTMPDGTEMAGATHEEYEKQMEGLMDKETPMLPDEEMEADYVNYVVNQTLSTEDQDYLDSALTKDDRLSELFDEVVESAAEFSGSGPIDGPGSEVSDSIPARLSDGEFVFTAKAADEIGADQLQRLMKDAEAGADRRQGVAYGGILDDDKKAGIAVSTQGSIAAAGGVPPVVSLDPIREEQLLSMQSSSPRRGYRTISG